ncbi:MAG: transposase domain-containing protein [Halioglobus sp.]
MNAEFDKNFTTSEEVAFALKISIRAAQKKFYLAGTPSEKKRGTKTKFYPLAFCSGEIVDAVTIYRAKQEVASEPAIRPMRSLEQIQVAPGSYEDAKHRDKGIAQKHLLAVEAVVALIEQGRTRTRAIEIVSEEFEMKLRSVARWYDSVKKHPRTEWLDLLTPVWGKGRPVTSIDEDIIDLITDDFLRLEGPQWEACYDRLVWQLEGLDYNIPSSKKLRAEINRRFTKAEQKYLRSGKRFAKENLLPAQRRSVANDFAMLRINGDGYTHNVKVQWPDGAVCKPHVWYWQDVYSRRILAWHISKTENTDQVRLSFLDVITKYGIPEHIYTDNTTSVTSKKLTGGIRNRYRHKFVEGEPLGLWPLLGCRVHFSGVYYGGGNGRAKPIERMFSRKGGFGDRIDKHPAFQGAYVGPNVMEKPENYGQRAIDMATFEAVLSDSIARINAKPGRRTETAQGKYSYDQVFAESYSNAVISIPSKEQLRLFGMTAETVRVHKSGKFTLKAGSARGIERNEYWSRTLRDHYAGEQVVVRFDPANLHGVVSVYQKAGPFICDAEILDAKAFGDTQAGREYDRFAKQEMKHLKLSTEAKMRKSQLLETAEPPRADDPIISPPAVSRLVPTPHLGAGKKSPQQSLTPEQQAAHETISREFSERLKAQEARKKLAEESPVDRLRRWYAIDDKLQEGVNVDEGEKRWWESYQGTSEHKAGMRMIKNFGRDGYLGSREAGVSAG